MLVLIVKMDKVLMGLMEKERKKQTNKKTHPDFSYVYSDNISTFKNKEQMLQACTWKDQVFNEEKKKDQYRTSQVPHYSTGENTYEGKEKRETEITKYLMRASFLFAK